MFKDVSVVSARSLLSDVEEFLISLVSFVICDIKTGVMIGCELDWAGP